MFLCTKDGIVSSSRSQRKGSSKLASVQKDKDKKVKESQKSKKRVSSKTKLKRSDGSHTLLHASSTSDGTDQDHQQGGLELKRSQRQDILTPQEFLSVGVSLIECFSASFFVQFDHFSLGCTSWWRGGSEDLVLLTVTREV